MQDWKPLIVKRMKELDPKGEILTVFDEKNRKIDFNKCIKQYQKQNFEDEAYIRAYLVLRLVRELGYPCNAIELEKKYSIGHPSRIPCKNNSTKYPLLAKNLNCILYEVEDLFITSRYNMFGKRS